MQGKVKTDFGCRIAKFPMDTALNKTLNRPMSTRILVFRVCDVLYEIGRIKEGTGEFEVCGAYETLGMRLYDSRLR